VFAVFTLVLKELRKTRWTNASAYTPEATNTGSGFNRGPGGVASKNGQGHMRVQRGVISYSPRPLSVATKPAVGILIFRPKKFDGGEKVFVLYIAVFQRRNPRPTHACCPPRCL